MFALTGLGALLWFLVRVIPKPSRATYPCQRVAFPLASSFVVWLFGLAGSAAAYHRARRHLARARYALAMLCIFVSVAFIYISITASSQRASLAEEPRQPQPALEPTGTAQGIHPGRVVWVHDPNATDWEYVSQSQSEHWFEQDHTDQQVVNEMVSRAIRGLADETIDANAWDAIFRYFNQQRGKGDVGYTAGEKVAIKINFTLTHGSDAVTMDKNPPWDDYMNYIDNSPQLSIALLKQLTDVVGIDACDITIGDPGRIMPNYWYDMVEPNCPNVVYLARAGGKGRTEAQWSGRAFNWSDPCSAHFAGVTETDHIPVSFFEADYIINFPVLKTHSQSGITLCGKNHYGSLIRNPSAWEMPNPSEWYDMHHSRILAEESPGMGKYRAIVDLMGHPELGGKTLLYMIDGLFAGEWWNAVPVKWQTEPFNNDWPSSIFVSQDGVAVDSVGFDFLLAEWPKNGDGTVDNPVGANSDGADDYLHEAALAQAPPSGTFYDPNDDGAGLSSLGVHEHWNDPNLKQYSRNLDPLNGTGIELVTVSEQLVEPGASLVEVYSDSVFFEGPSWDRGTGKLYFSARGTPMQILRLDSPGSATVWYNDTNNVNGTFIGLDGRLLTAEEDPKGIGSYKIGAAGPEDARTLADASDGINKQPNDICQTRRGDIYFTGPSWPAADCVVYRLATNGSVSEVITDMTQPNGIIASDDGTKLYVSDSTDKLWKVYPINPDGTVGAGEVFFNPSTSNTNDPDGMTIDERGNVYLMGRGGLWIVSPQGELLKMISISEFCSNVTFGGPEGKTLYITCQDKVYSLAMQVRGGGYQWNFMPPSETARNPFPRDKTRGVNPNITLSWTPGDLIGDVNGHDVYLHTKESYVISATHTWPLHSKQKASPYYGRQDANSFVPFDGLEMAMTYYWRIDEVNESDPCIWRGEIWSFTTASPEAANPSPESGETVAFDVGEAANLTLTWEGGLRVGDANGHEVYFGTSQSAVESASPGNPLGVYKGSVSEPCYTATDLLLDTTYYWRIDEVNDPCTWEGPVWNFAIANYRIADDFEEDSSNSNLWARWTDGVYNGTGSRIFHASGSSLMEFTYDNNGTGSGDDYYSESCREWSGAGVDLTLGDSLLDAAALAISFKGNSENAADPVYDRMYVAVEDTAGNIAVVLNHDPNAQIIKNWTQWNIDLRDFNDPCEADLEHARRLYLGFGVRGNPQGGTAGGEGSVYFDDLRVYIPRCVGLAPYRQAGDIAGGGDDNVGDCVVDELDLEVMAEDWLYVDYVQLLFDPGTGGLVAKWDFDDQTYDNNDNTIAGGLADGTAHGNASIVYDGQRGSYVLSLPQNDSNDYVDCGGGGSATWGHLPNSFTLCAWVKQTEFQPWGCFVTKGEFAWKLQMLHVSPVVHFATHEYGTTSATSLNSGQWYHVAAYYDDDANCVAIYVNGEMERYMCYWPPYYSEWDEANVFLGARHTPYYSPEIDQYFNGYLDDVRIYNRALWDSEIKYLATNGAANWYYPLESEANIYDAESRGDKIINFKDFAVLGEDWLKAKFWPSAVP